MSSTKKAKEAEKPVALIEIYCNDILLLVCGKEKLPILLREKVRYQIGQSN